MKDLEIQEHIKGGWLHIRMVQEVAGFPKEHVENTMDIMNGKLADLKGVKIVDRKIHDAKIIDEKHKIWSSYAEIEFLVDNLYKIMAIIFEFMPASIEILEPESIREDTKELTGVFNDMIGKLHYLDTAVKKLYAKGKFLEKKLGIEKKS